LIAGFTENPSIIFWMFRALNSVTSAAPIAARNITIANMTQYSTVERGSLYSLDYRIYISLWIYSK